MAKKIDGKLLSAKVKEEIRIKVDKCRSSTGNVPGLAVILVGEDSASEIYVNNKHKACIDAGFKSVVDRLPENTGLSDLLSLINEYNNDPSIHGILVQLPLPKHIDERIVLFSITPEKDVDGFHPMNVGLMNINDSSAMVPCTPSGIMRMFQEYEIELKGKNITIVGWGHIVGRPLSTLLLKQDATVTVCNIFTEDLKSHTQNADILISAAGVAGLIKEDMVKPGAVVIDVGINRVDGKVVGDVDFTNVEKVASLITPVPGGVGPMTIAMLLDNTFKAFEKLS